MHKYRLNRASFLDFEMFDLLRIGSGFLGSEDTSLDKNRL
jgi:hypothetical protein